MEEIKKTLTLTRQMSLAQAVEYFAEQKDGLEPLVAQVPLPAKSRQAFEAARALLEAAYKHALASPRQ